ncbi:MAG: hypothetical protein PHV02_05370 [Rhodocyclaceae bacterium]|nr:hypothetical protein [Rhodocyclaceae bacterium]
MTTSVRIPPRLEQALARYCVETQRSKSEVIIELLQNHLTSEPALKTPYELACETGFIGAVALDEDAAENSRNAVRAAIASKHHQATE